MSLQNLPAIFLQLLQGRGNSIKNIYFPFTRKEKTTVIENNVLLNLSLKYIHIV